MPEPSEPSAQVRAKPEPPSANGQFKSFHEVKILARGTTLDYASRLCLAPEKIIDPCIGFNNSSAKNVSMRNTSSD
jgi:hypothetical protein